MINTLGEDVDRMRPRLRVRRIQSLTYLLFMRCRDRRMQPFTTPRELVPCLGS